MKGNVQNVLDKILNEMKDEFILASATFLDTQSFSCLEFDEILASAIKIKDCYSKQLTADGCNIDCLNAELRILYSHVNKFLSNATLTTCWPRLFILKRRFGHQKYPPHR